MSFSRLPVIAAALLVSAGMTAARADNLSAAAADAALASGALAWDVRADARTGLPRAFLVDAASMQAWLDRGDLAALQAAVSLAGLDLSRDLVVYGEAGDVRAQALVDSLQSIARGRVHWLVGGAPEWAMTGRALEPRLAQRAPVPQRLVADISPSRVQMAGAALRGDAPDARVAAR